MDFVLLAIPVIFGVSSVCLANRAVRKGCKRKKALYMQIASFCAVFLVCFLCPMIASAAETADAAAQSAGAMGMGLIGAGIATGLSCIGGGIAGQGENLLGPLRSIIERERFTKLNEKQTQVCIATLGNDAGIIGAAYLD